MADLLTDDQVRGVLLLFNGGRVDLRRRRTLKRQPRLLRLERPCADCKKTLPLQAYVPIKGRPPGAVYGRCRACRAARARERYQAHPAEREKQQARVRRGRLRRMQSAN